MWLRLLCHPLLLSAAEAMICSVCVCVCVCAHERPSAFPPLQLAASIPQPGSWGGPGHFPTSALPNSTGLELGVTPSSEPSRAVQLLSSQLTPSTEKSGNLGLPLDRKSVV